MKGAIILKGFIGIFFLINISSRVHAEVGKPVGNIIFSHPAIKLIQTDTIPPPQKSKEVTKNKTEEVTIKTVPKARRQQVPIPVVNIKPVKIVKPKIRIIKPIIKVLH